MNVNNMENDRMLAEKMNMFYQDQPLGKIVISQDALQSRIAEMGRQLSEDYRDKTPVIVSVLKGAFYFVADLTRQMQIPMHIDFLSIGVYPGVTNKTGIVRITKDLDITITGRHVLMVEDIIGTGLTLGYIIQHLETRKPASIKICTLVDNPSGRLVSIPIEYRGFTLPDSYLIGYGLDSNEEFRNLPFIAELTR